MPVPGRGGLRPFFINSLLPVYRIGHNSNVLFQRTITALVCVGWTGFEQVEGLDNVFGVAASESRMLEGPGLKPSDFDAPLPRAKARCYSENKYGGSGLDEAEPRMTRWRDGVLAGSTAHAATPRRQLRRFWTSSRMTRMWGTRRRR